MATGSQVASSSHWTWRVYAHSAQLQTPQQRIRLYLCDEDTLSGGGVLRFSNRMPESEFHTRATDADVAELVRTHVDSERGAARPLFAGISTCELTAAHIALSIEGPDVFAATTPTTAALDVCVPLSGELMSLHYTPQRVDGARDATYLRYTSEMGAAAAHPIVLEAFAVLSDSGDGGAALVDIFELNARIRVDALAHGSRERAMMDALRAQHIIAASLEADLAVLADCNSNVAPPPPPLLVHIDAGIGSRARAAGVKRTATRVKRSARSAGSATARSVRTGSRALRARASRAGTALRARATRASSVLRTRATALRSGVKSRVSALRASAGKARTGATQRLQRFRSSAAQRLQAWREQRAASAASAAARKPSSTTTAQKPSASLLARLRQRLQQRRQQQGANQKSAANDGTPSSASSNNPSTDTSTGGGAAVASASAPPPAPLPTSAVQSTSAPLPASAALPTSQAQAVPLNATQDSILQAALERNAISVQQLGALEEYGVSTSTASDLPPEVLLRVMNASRTLRSRYDQAVEHQRELADNSDGSVNPALFDAEGLPISVQQWRAAQIPPGSMTSAQRVDYVQRGISPLGMMLPAYPPRDAAAAAAAADTSSSSAPQSVPTSSADYVMVPQTLLDRLMQDSEDNDAEQWAIIKEFGEMLALNSAAAATTSSTGAHVSVPRRDIEEALFEPSTGVHASLAAVEDDDDADDEETAFLERAAAIESSLSTTTALLHVDAALQQQSNGEDRVSAAAAAVSAYMLDDSAAANTPLSAVFYYQRASAAVADASLSQQLQQQLQTSHVMHALCTSYDAVANGSERFTRSQLYHALVADRQFLGGGTLAMPSQQSSAEHLQRFSAAWASRIAYDLNRADSHICDLIDGGSASAAQWCTCSSGAHAREAALRADALLARAKISLVSASSSSSQQIR